ncbi:hypothetical protein VIGAN_03232800 [Vigna angularis var. angularis]|uniref:Uncharacterized protein n=1 Tax=Vigna angularis var. angularis TaxID=157739 RepID=A0A0S3RP01_PHAAN|nr:hypothetical protein VIGAN_03232800 [Vigna angularis var. angularis]
MHLKIRSFPLRLCHSALQQQDRNSNLEPGKRTHQTPPLPPLLSFLLDSQNHKIQLSNHTHFKYCSYYYY